MDIFELYMKVVGVLHSILEYYNKINYFIYKILMRGDLSLEKFYLSEENVGLWILIAFSIVICFSLLFIPFKGVSGKQRKERIWIRRIVPVGIILAPFPMIIYLTIFIGYVLRRILKFVYKILSNVAQSLAKTGK